MNFFQRFVNLARADAHGVLDSLEDRSLALRQCLREAELEVTRKRFRLEALDVAHEACERQSARLEKHVQALDEDVRLSLERSEDELARYAIRRLLAARRQAREQLERARDLAEERAPLAEKLERQERELEELRDRVKEALRKEREDRTRECSGGPDEGDALSTDGVSDEEIELELLRRRPATPSHELRK